MWTMNQVKVFVLESHSLVTVVEGKRLFQLNWGAGEG